MKRPKFGDTQEIERKDPPSQLRIWKPDNFFINFGVFAVYLSRFYHYRNMSCCPPNAEKYLAASYSTIGQTHALPNGHEFYITGSTTATKAVIVIPDVFGWNAGRTRNVADWFAEAGYLTIVPKLMVPALEGGTDGDGSSTLSVKRQL